MSRFAQGMAVAALISLPLVAWGHGFGLVRPRTTVAYYYPAPVEYVPVAAYPAYPVCVPPTLPVYPAGPRLSVPGPTYAPPTAAPPPPSLLPSSRRLGAPMT